MQARLEPTIARYGLTTSQFGVLEALLHLGPLHQQELATKLLVSKGNITLVVRNLSRAGLVARSGSPGDRRKTVVALTPAGRRKIAQVFPRHVAAIGREFAALSATEQEAFSRLCRKLGRGQPRMSPTMVTSRPARAERRSPGPRTSTLPRHAAP